MHRLALQRSRRRRLALSAAGFACIGATAAIAIFNGVGPGEPAEASAATVLAKTAVVAAHEATQRPAPTPTPFFYVRSRNVGTVRPATAGAQAAGDRPIPSASTREIWTSIERPGRLLTTPRGGTAGFPTPGSGRIGSIGALGHYSVGSIRLTRRQLTSFPTDPAALYERLRKGAVGRGSSLEAQVLDDIAVALGEQPIPPDLRAALYRTLALTPGVRLSDADSSAEKTVALDDGPVRYELTFNPETSELLAIRDVAEGAVVRETHYETRAVTDTRTRP